MGSLRLLVLRKPGAALGDRQARDRTRLRSAERRVSAGLPGMCGALPGGLLPLRHGFRSAVLHRRGDRPGAARRPARAAAGPPPVHLRGLPLRGAHAPLLRVVPRDGRRAPGLPGERGDDTPRHRRVARREHSSRRRGGDGGGGLSGLLLGPTGHRLAGWSARRWWRSGRRAGATPRCSTGSCAT